MSSPTQRSLALLRRRGLVVAVVEKWIPQTKRRLDMWGWVDLTALDPVTGEILFVQTTSSSNVAARIDKIQAWPHLAAFLLRHRAVVHGWSKRGDRGKRKLWACREVEVSAPRLPSESPPALSLETPFSALESA